MEIVRELREIPNLSLALGLFDGVHIGHQAVINCAVEYARSVFTQAAVVTFNQNPHSYLNEITPKYILTLDDKYKCFEDMGIDYVIELDFSQICKMSPQAYLEDVLVKYFSPMAISTGFNHKFGNGRAGTVKFLSDNQDKYNYVFFATPPQAIWGDIVSSTSIREFIKSGATDMAATMLGRQFSVEGTVVKGRELGRTIGYPTANMIFPIDIVEPPYGVYGVDVYLDDGTVKKGIANFGVSPTVSNDGIAILEVYILNFNGDLYDKQIRIAFNSMVRREIKFDNLDDLKTQIDFDIQALNQF
jgi:riboflavin kinase/FMN adenylyltransferase